MKMPFGVDAPLGMIEPLLIVSVLGILLLLVDLLLPHGKKHHTAWLALAGIVYAMIRTASQWGQFQVGYSGMVVLDNLSTALNLLFLASTGVVVLLSMPFLKKEDVEPSEYYALLLFATVGMMILASGLDLITLFLGIEVLSISLYILAGYRRDSDASNEAAMKYFLLGAFASSVLLYGIALVYGATGTTSLVRIAETVSGSATMPEGLMFAGVALILVGLAFKVAAAPFHMWTPDVYDGAPTPITAFLSAGPKAAAFAALIRTFFIGFGPIQAEWNTILAVIAALTMTIGNIAAIAQTRVKRMLAYSSIAHSGYVLIGIVAGGAAGGAAAVFYLFAYVAMNLGAFAVVVLLEYKGERGEELRDYAGIGFRYPVIGALLSLFMISLSGIPPTAGFVGKLYLFGAAVQSGHVLLAVIGVLNSAISIFYYLRLMVLMYMREEQETLPAIRVPWTLAICLLIAAVATLGPGLWPSAWIDAAREGMRALFS
ncbi:MAG TPA: NADH-quinone oxidoreductase subunit N [Candidatus Eisenbacteria bacterium]|jgi:NADH-quinone oxidoreductase subunit N|nr:NADH-quinone oxidoreductase subunit N [Candidatus Eisenbacteria bacterium]